MTAQEKHFVALLWLLMLLCNIAVPAQAQVTAISAGTEHTCALFASGAIKCWGNNVDGRLGLGDTTTRGTTNTTLGSNLPVLNFGCAQTAMRVQAAETHTCAQLSTGAVKCWGYANYGQVGQGDNITRGDQAAEMEFSLPDVKYLDTSVTSLSASIYSTCGILGNGSLRCWGFGLDGQLGYGNAVNLGGDPADVVSNVYVGSGRTVKSVAIGWHACAILDDNSLKCWGYNDYGQLGYENTNPTYQPEPQSIMLGTGRTVKSVAVGGYHTCAVLDDARLKCWGSNSYGQLGLGDAKHRGDEPGEMGDSLPTVDLGTGRTAKAVTAGLHHTCALLDNGSVKCWGFNNYGQLGQGHKNRLGDGPNEVGNSLAAVNLGSGRTAVAIAAGGYHTCAILDTGVVKCWGCNSFGQLGIGSTLHMGDDANDMATLPTVQLGSGLPISCPPPPSPPRPPPRDDGGQGGNQPTPSVPGSGDKLLPIIVPVVVVAAVVAVAMLLASAYLYQRRKRALSELSDQVREASGFDNSAPPSPAAVPAGGGIQRTVSTVTVEVGPEGGVYRTTSSCFSQLRHRAAP